MYLLLGISLMLSLLLVLNLLVSAAAAMLWRVLAPTAKNWTAQRQAQVIFIFRIFPLIAALLFIVALVLPAYFLFEPHSSKETVSVKLAFLAFISTIGVGIAAYSVFGTWWRTRRLLADWLAHAERIFIDDVKIPFYLIHHPFPVISVVGAFRPRMFVARQVFAALDDKEVGAAIRHEYGHLAARDNLKRSLMRIARDLLVIPFGCSLDCAWAEKVESAADEYAAHTGGKSAALNLASALVKIARIVPPNTKPAMPAGAFLIEAPTVDITERVHHLVKLSEIKVVAAKSPCLKTKNVLWLYAGGFFVFALLLTANNMILHKIHFALEAVVGILQ